MPSGCARRFLATKQKEATKPNNKAGFKKPGNKQHHNTSSGSRTGAKAGKGKRPGSEPAPAASGAPDPQLEKEIKAIRAETNQSERRTKLYWLVDKLDKRGRAHSYNIKSIDMRFFTWLIGTLGDQGMLKQALLVLDKIKAAKVKPDAIIYNSLINSCAKMNRMKQALHIYEDMRAQGIPTDQRTLSAVMNVFSRMGDIDRVKTLKAEMEASGQKLDSFNYGCVMKAYGQNGRVEDLLALWDEIKDKEKAGQLDVDSYLYTITIGSLGRNGQIKDMLNLWHEMKARSRSVEGRRLRPDVVSYTTLIDSLGHNGDIERMISTLAEMKHEAALEEQRLKEEKEQRALNMEIEPLKEKMPKFELWPNEQTYTCIFNHLGKAGEVRRIAKIYDELRRGASFQFNVQVYTALINGFGRAGDLARMQKVYDRMRQEEIRPTAQTYTALIEAFTKHGSPYGVVDMWKQVKHQTFLPDSRLFHALVKGLPADRLHDLLDVFWFMKTQQHRVTPFIYARIIDSIKGAKRDDEMERVVAELEKEGVVESVDRATCQAIADLWERRGNNAAKRALWIERAKHAREFVPSSGGSDHAVGDHAGEQH
ncbi:pentatricopeptide repeat domain/PPR repeatcontaining protein [Acanthamoeba castellanii str. Neff]|uniref:Pentatricopeptide repeat domain/PPR repeatcontaining protein n=1 Tax=Acanthamoeba castellanii (strain ATCC 30010 / Neff) TaxID=1257118 RepID=L8GMD0_ACACF|nr:pentatricopeptide repeat domain/PPR repeatcontaining protein [Acanthamoeba castellanii str. Neff]ELR14122.1 pentatricopeptide repeat domain/PPR repeatcontaining protein [Acanthamoeba castellanii str. Neff]